MGFFTGVAANLLLFFSLGGLPAGSAGGVDIPVYKGALRVFVPDKQTRDSLVIRYRSKTREVVRIAVNDASLINIRTKRVISLQDQSASLQNRIDRGGFWNTDISYSDLNLGADDYRITGRLTLYLIGSQRTSDFSAYLRQRAGGRPEGSSIDWGLSD